MIVIRQYHEDDACTVGRLIADTYSEYNLSCFPPEEVGKFLGPFRHAHSSDPAQQAEIARMIDSEMVFVAEEDGEIVGVLRGRKERLASLFVRGDHHRQGVGRMLVQRFEDESRTLGVRVIRISATVYAVPFYRAMGYQRSTGLRRAWSFDGHGLPVQPMKKKLSGTDSNS
ncbi:MAG: GNAT family N-acetyltransferase [Anaerolineae bacterium]|nr:GNAT family N-acetyltransferase [Anaerolineae bacterium]